MWSSEPLKGVAVCGAKAISSFLSHFKTMSIGPVPGIEPATSRSACPKRKEVELQLRVKFNAFTC